VNDVASVEIWAYFTPPTSKAWPKRRRCDAIGTKHRAKPDFDNIAKALVDALWKEDSGIADAAVHKRWSWDDRLEVAIALEPDDSNF
jgi:Holliday junction resolvase RusA-like endonuclease